MMKKPENDEAREFEEKFREVPYFGGLDPLYNVVLALHASVPKKTARSVQQYRHSSRERQTER